MNKNDLIAAVADGADLTRAKAGDAVDAVLAAITAALKRKDEVRLAGFGTFVAAERKAPKIPVTVIPSGGRVDVGPFWIGRAAHPLPTRGRAASPHRASFASGNAPVKDKEWSPTINRFYR